MPNLPVPRSFIVHYAMVVLILCEEIIMYVTSRLCLRYNCAIYRRRSANFISMSVTVDLRTIKAMYTVRGETLTLNGHDRSRITAAETKVLREPAKIHAV